MIIEGQINYYIRYTRPLISIFVGSLRLIFAVQYLIWKHQLFPQYTISTPMKTLGDVQSNPNQQSLKKARWQPQLLKISTENNLQSVTCGPFSTKTPLPLVGQKAYWLFKY